MSAEPTPVPQKPTPSTAPASATELRARRTLIIAIIVVALAVIGMVTLLVFLSINAYRAAMAGGPPDPGAVVVGLLRDAAIILVAFETLIIGVLLIVLTIQVQTLIAMLRDEIRPMLEAVNDTVATVRGTALFVSHNVVSPTIQAAGFAAGVQRVAQEIVALLRPPKSRKE